MGRLKMNAEGEPMNILSSIAKILPESEFKESLKRVFFRYIHNSLYDKNKRLNVKQFEDGTICLELSEGLIFYGRPMGNPPRNPEFTYGRPEKMDKIHHLTLRLILLATGGLGTGGKYYRIKEGHTVIDAGAHIGLFTVRAAKIVGNEGKVIAIEPEKDNLAFLKRNIEANEIKNVLIVPKGLWGERGLRKLYLNIDDNAAHTLTGTQFTNIEYASKFEDIEVDTLDNILKELRVSKVDFIKMDIEGAEIEALKGMKETLQNNDYIFIQY